MGVGVLVLLVLPLAVFGGVLHATRNEKNQCASEAMLNGIKVCES